MTYGEWVRFSDRVTWKRGLPVLIRVRLSSVADSWEVRVSLQSPCVDGLTDRNIVYQLHMLDESLSEKQAMREVRRCVSKMFEHEIDESLRLDGKYLVDPHPDRAET